MITNRSQIFLENDKVAIMCAINTLYYISGRISHSSFHAKTLPPSFIQPLIFFALCHRGLLCCGLLPVYAAALHLLSALSGFSCPTM